MHIAFISHSDFNLWRFRLPLMEQLVGEGVRVSAICPEGEYSKEFRAYGIEHVSWKISGAQTTLWRDLKSIFALGGILKKIKPDCVHSFTLKANIYGSLVAYLAKVPRIFLTITGRGRLYCYDDIKTQALRFCVEKMLIFVFGFCEKVVFQNDDDLNYFQNIKTFKRNKYCVVRGSGIDLDEWRNIGFLKEKETIAIGFVSRLFREKGVFYFLELAKLLLEQNLPVKFYLAGPYEDKTVSFDEFRATCASCGVHYEGACFDVRAFLEKLEIFVYPSVYYEGLPRVLLEAAAMELAIVGFDTVGVKDVLEEGETGLVVKKGDVFALTEAVKRLVLDSELRSGLKKGARAKIEGNFEQSLIVTEYRNLYFCSAKAE